MPQERVDSQHRTPQSRVYNCEIGRLIQKHHEEKSGETGRKAVFPRSFCCLSTDLFVRRKWSMVLNVVTCAHRSDHLRTLFWSSACIVLIICARCSDHLHTLFWSSARIVFKHFQAFLQPSQAIRQHSFYIRYSMLCEMFWSALSENNPLIIRHFPFYYLSLRQFIFRCFKTISF